ncbi:hypothetical protein GCM10025858_39440 [Alicyclobacillus sacchari]|uniref:DinB/UmuC family translesion DNA polymerase n=1 Tax=Alicyclobacillus sacchari TaxID=392010 RepID=UPI0023E9EB30|nr:hypothetical protein [Alicyclobacillus sacchari]GMA59440.1 hypothetical protein GCM10025858_39440 [Alicyclobacillus sacchari]
MGLGLTYEGLTGGFYRAKTLPRATNDPGELYPVLLALLDQHWDGSGVRAVSVSVDMLQFRETVQLSLFENVLARTRLYETVDEIRARYGKTSIMRAVSLTRAGQLRERSMRIGGHYS